MKKIRAIVSGTVQNVGYRAKVITIAKVLGLTGFVQNRDDGRVRIIAEGADGDLDRFIDVLRIKNTLIDVDAVEVEYADAAGDYDDFYRLVCEEEADDPMDRIIEYLKELIDVNERGFSGIRSDMQEMRTEIREVRTAVGGVRTELGEVRAEVKSGFENLDSKMDVMIDETRGLREDMKSYMDRKFGEIDCELAIIKTALRANGTLS